MAMGNLTGKARSHAFLRCAFVVVAAHARPVEGHQAPSHLSGLVLVMVDADLLGPPLKWEPSCGGALFPHLYAPLDTSAAIWVTELPDGEARAACLGSLPD